QPHQQQMDDEINQLMAQATSQLRSNTLFGEEYILQNSVPVSSLTTKVGRNDPCPCGSGKKYKKCCLH
ncbi:SEC-C metal-binding domain-containing protein, partial [Catenovulum agarivorans]|uniref:SEC-C metal-binding domain-containing protein n=1 Tax=Catenovulum agarivorans TaxID=1172192 RepID=UPI000474C6C7